MVNDKQPFELRCAILYCLQCYLHKNQQRQEEIMNTLLPSHETVDENEITAGQLLCGGLFSNDGVSNWLSAVALAHGMMDQEALKTELLKVQVASIKDSGGKCISQVKLRNFTVMSPFFRKNFVKTTFSLISYSELISRNILQVTVSFWFFFTVLCVRVIFFSHFQDPLLC